MLMPEERKHYRFALHHLGFRPFFLLAGLFAVVSMVIWYWRYRYQPVLAHMDQLPASLWHGHEMIFGYALAVAAGFLLTAERNWTSVPTLQGMPLMLLALLWLIARIAPFVDHSVALPVMAASDLGFGLWLCFALLTPIVKVKQWQHLGIWLMIALLVVVNALFYLQLFQQLSVAPRNLELAALYILLLLVLLMGRRVIPFFIEKGAGYAVHLTNHRWLDVAAVVLFVLFALVDLAAPYSVLVVLLAWSQVVLHLYRLYGWYTVGIWHKPLLWVLFVGYIWIIGGLFIKGLIALQWLDALFGLHAFAYGTLGIITLGMMARVSLGHTGRDVFNPPLILFWLFAFLFIGSIVRVLFPIFLPTLYSTWIVSAQILWISSFAGFCWIYVPILIKGRIDGRYG